MKKFKVGSYRPGESGIRKALGELEADIMELVWQRETCLVRDIHDDLARDRDIAYTTVMTVMSRLSDKGILRKERDGKHYVYYPTTSKDEFNDAMCRSVMSGLKADLGAKALAFFVESLSEDENTLEELERLIQEKRKHS